MNLILDGLPETVEIAGEEIPIATDYRVGILMEEVVNDRELSDQDKLLAIFELYFPERYFPAEQLDEVFTAIMDFYRGGAPADNGKGGSSVERAFDYEYDADYVYAAFYAAYRIDLARDNLHWWQFRALFRALPDDTMLVKIIGYRTMKIPPKMSKEQKDHYKALKAHYALPVVKTEADKELERLLMYGRRNT